MSLLAFLLRSCALSVAMGAFQLWENHFEAISGFRVYDLLLQLSLAMAASAFVSKKNLLLLLQAVLSIEFSLAHRLKLATIQQPFVPSDLFLYREFFQILSTGQKCALALLCVVTAALVWACLKSFRLPEKRWVALTLPAGVAILTLALFPTAYIRFWGLVLGDDVPGLVRYRQAVYGEAITFSLESAHLLESTLKVPGVAQVNTAREYLNAETRESQGKRPAGEFAHSLPRTSSHRKNVYVILTESFWEPVVLSDGYEAFRRSNHSAGLTRLSEDFNALWTQSGRRLMLSPTYGAGTANVEFEVLCGMPAVSGKGRIIFRTDLRNEVACLPRVLLTQGYRTYAFHANTPDYYNRASAFPLLGFQRFFAESDFDTHQKAGNFLEDDSFFQQSLKLAKQTAAGAPFLAYLMTSAGHWPYPWVEGLHEAVFTIKGPGGSEPRFKSEQAKVEFEELQRQININYYTSNLVARWIHQIQEQDRDSIILVAGDHLPGIAATVAPLESSRSVLADPEFYMTPLLVFGGTAPHRIQPLTPAFALPREILYRADIPLDAAHPMSVFAGGADRWVRPLSDGNSIVVENSTPALCIGSDTSARCQRSRAWEMAASVIQADQTFGNQYFNSSADRKDNIPNAHSPP